MSSAEEFRKQMAEKYGAAEPVQSEPVVSPERMREKYREVPVAEDMGRGALAGVVSGTASLADMAQKLTPAGMIDNTLDWAAWGANKLMPDKVSAPKEPVHILTPNVKKELSELTGGVDKYEPKTTPGRYSKSVGEFLPGALVPMGKVNTVGQIARNVITGAVAPGLASEAAGQLTEGTEYEPYARIAASLASPLAAEMGVRSLGKVIAPNSGINPERLRKAQILSDADIPVTAGQKTGNMGLLANEQTTTTGQRMISSQPEIYTKRVMEHLGLPDEPLATPLAMSKARDSIVSDLKIADLANPAAERADVNKVVSAITDYKKFSDNSADKVPAAVMDAARQIFYSSQNGTKIPGHILRKWRTEFGDKAASSTNNSISDLYRKMVDSIDDLVSKDLSSRGKIEELETLKIARQRYRDWLAVSNASLKSADGILDPAHVVSALNSQGKTAMATGKRKDLGDLSYAAKGLFERSQAQPSRPLMSRLAEMGTSAAATGVPIAYMSGMPFLGAAAGALGATLPPIMHGAGRLARELTMTKAAQKYLSRQSDLADSLTGFKSDALNSAIKQAPVLLDRQERKRGGRVSVHDAEADRLVGLAERAKKAFSKSTEPLLNTPDEVVATALEAANRSI